MTGSDRHSIFHRSAQETESLEEQLAGERRPTQFGEALQTLEKTSGTDKITDQLALTYSMTVDSLAGTP